MPPLKRFVLAILATALLGASSAAPEYSIEAIHYGTTPGFAASDLIIGAPKSDKLDIYFILWLVRGGGRNILFDSGFHRAKFIKQWNVKDFVAPDEAVRRAGVKPEDMPGIRSRLKELGLEPYDCLSPALMDAIATHVAKAKAA